MSTATNAAPARLGDKGSHSRPLLFRVVMGLAGLLAAGSLVTLILSDQPMSWAVASNDAPDRVYEQIVVQPGDTLWEISTRLSHNADQAEVLEDILAYNDLETSQLEVGQTLYIPVIETEHTAL